MTNLGNVLTGRVGLSPIMVGRNSAVDRLRTVVEMAEVHASDLPTVALIAGEAGIGKTRLLREMLAILPSDVTVFSAIAEPQSIGRPYEVAQQLAPIDRRAVEDGLDPAQPAIDAITAAARHGRVAVVIEDLHWIDSDSVNVMDAIARQPLPNVVLFATYRPSDLSRGAPGGDLLLRLERRNEVDQFRLDRLDRAEVGMMIGAIIGRHPSSAAVEAVYRRSGGVPFVVEELLRVAGPEACSDDIIEAELPWSLEEAIRQQINDLEPQERAIVEVLAVFGQPAGFEELAAVTAIEERELLTQLRRLVSSGVIEETRNDRLWFGHALLAESVRQQLLGRERRRLHEACFDAVSQLAADDYAALAHHANGAGRFDDIVPIAREGARHYLDRGATFQALRLATTGLDEDRDDPDLLAVATEAAWRLDFLGEAVEHARAWRRVAPDLAGRIDAMRYEGRIEIEQRGSNATAIIDELMALSETLPDGSDRARAEAAVAQLLMLSDDPRLEEWAEKAITDAEASGDKQIIVQARLEWASAQPHYAERTFALAAMRDVIDDARAIGDGVLLSRALNNTMLLVPPNSEESRTMRAELRATAAAYGFDKLGHVTVMWWDALAAQAAGDLALFRRTLDEWISWRRPSTNMSDYQSLAISLAAEDGRVADGYALFTDDTISMWCSSDISHAELQVARLSLTAVAQDAQSGRVAFDRLVATPMIADTWFALEAMLHATASAIEVGISTAEIRERLLHTYLAGHPSQAEITMSCEGLLALAEGRHADAITSLQATLATADDTLPTYIAGSTWLALATALLGAGERARAIDAAHRAAATLRNWPGWRRDRVEAMLARLEGPAVRPNSELTARESEVAALIAEGLTNGQLAERLFISPKTAAVHVSNILAKLGLSSRTEIAAWAIRRSLPTPA